MLSSNIRMGGKKCHLSDFDWGVIVAARWAVLSISCWSPGILSHNISKVHSDWCKKAILQRETSFWWQRSEENGRTGFGMTEKEATDIGGGSGKDSTGQMNTGKMQLETLMKLDFCRIRVRLGQEKTNQARLKPTRNRPKHYVFPYYRRMQCKKLSTEPIQWDRTQIIISKCLSSLSRWVWVVFPHSSQNTVGKGMNPRTRTALLQQSMLVVVLFEHSICTLWATWIQINHGLNATCLKKLVSWRWQWLQWPPPSPDLSSRAFCDVAEQEIGSMNVAADKSAERLWCNHVDMEEESQRNVSSILWNPWHEELRCFWERGPFPY